MFNDDIILLPIFAVIPPHSVSFSEVRLRDPGKLCLHPRASQMTDMGASEKFCLKWNDFETNISMAFRELREDKDFFDITLVCDNEEQVEAHKVVLSACSPFFRSLLRRNRHQHPLLFLRGVSLQELLAVLTFMYHGEVNVAQEELNSFLALAEELQVKGLTQGSQGAGAKRGAKRPSAQKDERSSKKSWNPAPQPALPVPALVEDEVEEVEEVVMVKSETPVNGTSALVEAESEEFAESYGEYDSFQYTTDSGQLGSAEGQDKGKHTQHPNILNFGAITLFGYLSLSSFKPPGCRVMGRIPLGV